MPIFLVNPPFTELLTKFLEVSQTIVTKPLNQTQEQPHLASKQINPRTMRLLAHEKLNLQFESETIGAVKVRNEKGKP